MYCSDKIKKYSDEDFHSFSNYISMPNILFVLLSKSEFSDALEGLTSKDF